MVTLSCSPVRQVKERHQQNANQHAHHDGYSSVALMWFHVVSDLIVSALGAGLNADDFATHGGTVAGA
jgi:hypothetical protein